MDDAEGRLTESLMWRFSVWICGAILLTGIVTAGLSFHFAFEEIQDLQDDQLREIAWLVPANNSSSFSSIGGTDGELEPETRIWVVRILERDNIDSAASMAPRIPGSLEDGLHTINVGGEQWRAYVRTLGSGERIAAAQRTSPRTEVARDSGLRTLWPVVALIPLLSIIVAMLIRFLLRTIRSLSGAVDAKGDANLTPLTTQNVPREISPFVHSINRLLHRLDDTLERERQFVAHAAHELRSPVTALTLQVENLAGSTLADETRGRLLPIGESIIRMSALVEQLLELSRLHGHVQRERQRIQVLRVAKEVITELLSFAESQGVDLGMEAAVPVEILGHEDDFRALVRNAIDNAIRYSPHGGRVDVIVQRTPELAIFEVIDTGPGIPDDEMSRVFAPFYRILGSGKTGSGLGLAIIKNAADKLGGLVTLENVPVSDIGGLRFRYTQQALDHPEALAKNGLLHKQEQCHTAKWGTRPMRK